MKFGARDQRDRVTLPDITSMVDVVFLLIIFFLTTSSLVRATVSEIDLPEQEGNIDARTEDGGLVVNISANGAYLVEGEDVGLTELLGMIEAEAGEAASIEDVEVLVRADQDARLAPVNRLAAGLVELGVRDWKLATRAPRGGAGSAGAANAGGDD
jgi:biopolymer transport protein ExbD